MEEKKETVLDNEANLGKKIVAYFSVVFLVFFSQQILQGLLLCMLPAAAVVVDLCILAPSSHLTLMESHKLGKGQICSPL